MVNCTIKNLPPLYALCLCVRFDGEEIKTDETIRTLAQKWQPSRRPRSEERNTKAVDTDMIVVSCVVSFSNFLIANIMISCLLFWNFTSMYITNGDMKR